MANPKKCPSRRFIWFRRIVRFACVIGIILVFLGVWGIFQVTRPKYLARLASKKLTTLAGVPVSVEEAYISLFGTISLKKVSIRSSNAGGDANRFFEAGEVIIEENPLPLIFESRLDIRSIDIAEPCVYITENPATGRYNFNDFAPSSSGPGGAPSVPIDMPKPLPAVSVHSAKIQIGSLEETGYMELGRLSVNGRLLPVPSEPGVYSFKLQQQTGAVNGPSLWGTVDLHNYALKAQIDQLAFDAPQRAALPKRFRQWWDTLQPEGQFPDVRFGYDPTDPDIGFHADLALKGLAITLPYKDLRKRMSDVSGRVALSSNNITIQALRGRIESLPYEITGRINGYDADPSFNFDVRVGPFDIPEHPTDLASMPIAMQNQFNRFHPSGKFKANFRISRGPPDPRTHEDPEIRYIGSIHILDAKAQYARFAYPVGNLKGEIRIDNDAVNVVEITGQAFTGARMRVKGKVWPPNDDAAVDLMIEGWDIPLDDNLKNAMKEDYDFINMLLCQSAYKASIDRGTIQTMAAKAKAANQRKELAAKRQAVGARKDADPKDLAELDQQIHDLDQVLQVPAFDLGGRMNMTAHVQNPGGGTPHYHTTVNVKPKGIWMMFEHWPYPLQFGEGTITVEPPRVTVTDIKLDGLTGTHATLNGKIGPAPGETSGYSPDLQLDTLDTPIDRILLESIPDEQAKLIRDLGLRGLIDVHGGTIFRIPDQKGVGFKLDTMLREASVTPFGGSYVIDHAAGHAVIERGKVTIDKLQGVHGATRFTANGATHWAADHPEYLVNIGATDLHPEDPVLEMVPSDTSGLDRIKAMQKKLEPQGHVDGTLVLKNNAEGKLDFDLALMPTEFSALRKGIRVELKNITGKVTISGPDLTLDHMAASLGTGRVTADGVIHIADPPTYNLAITADNTQIDEPTRGILPPEILRTIDGAKIKTGYSLSDAGLKQSINADGQVQLDLHGQIAVFNTSATLGVPVHFTSGGMAFRTSTVNATKKTSVDFQFMCPQVFASDRELTHFALEAGTDGQTGELVLRKLEGDVYNGKFIGEGKIDPQRGGRYALTFKLKDVDKEPFSNPALKPEELPSRDLPPEQRAKFSALLNLEGLPDDVASRHGHGDVDLKNANLNEVPVVMALFRIVNLSLPTGKGFDRVTAQYTVSGDQVIFDKDAIRFEAQNFGLLGRGNMKISTQELDLDFHTFNPNPLLANVVFDILSGVKNELLQIHIGGTISKPNTGLQTLSGVRDSLDSLFTPSARGPAPVQQVQPAAGLAPTTQSTQPATAPSDSPTTSGQ